VLAIDLLELLGRGLCIFLGIQKIKAFIVELVGGLLRSNGGVFVEQAAGAKCQRYEQNGRKSRRGARAALPPFKCQ
jgi:hypothetical protein